ncbi:hypothetical protein H6P81_018140 [Aristolochia fimbriata]|uniref:Uncharacterized protein n=1 Tax=Aristolochia fimbriata TaxID=158543 RepID=A0AAV7E335_ARIFI|nr:hypothetical protein H6P81_018140 [Aristolochia fimbriata]
MGIVAPSLEKKPRCEERSRNKGRNRGCNRTAIDVRSSHARRRRCPKPKPGPPEAITHRKRPTQRSSPKEEVVTKGGGRHQSSRSPLAMKSQEINSAQQKM